MVEADAYAEPARMFVQLGLERLADYQDIATRANISTG